MISLQTNVTSLDAQNNLNTDNLAQSKTIQQLSSGYRINSSGDDAAGLAVANQYRDNIAELTQGVSNASTGIAQLQIVDGGLSNISTILDRMKTLATESASGTFTGDRNTLDQEYQGLISEITRQATNVNLNSGGSFNSSLNVYIGGASTLANASVSIDLSGSSNAVDATSLGLAGTTVAGGGVGIGNNTLSLTTPGAMFVKGTAGTNDQTFTFNTVNSNGVATTVSAKVTASSSGSSLSQVLTSLNTQLNPYGITAGVDSTGALEFTGTTAFTVKDGGQAGTGGTNALTNDDSTHNTADNSSNYVVDGQTTYGALASGDTDTLVFTTSAGAQITVDLTNDNGATLSDALTAINNQTAAYGIYAVANSVGTGISLQSTDSFSMTDENSGAGLGVFSGTDTTATAQTVTAPTTSDGTDSADAAIVAINAAIQNLGLVQGRVGAGENLLQYATNLANSQITNFSTAQSDIRDADVAADASQLTQSQVLEQTAVAAMAQANSSSQVVLKLLQ